MNDNRNLFVAIALSALLLIGWQYFVAAPQLKAEQARQALLAGQQKKPQQPATVTAPEAVNTVPDAVSSPPAPLSRAEALKRSGARIAIRTPTVDGSFLLKGARFDDIPTSPSSAGAPQAPRSRCPTTRRRGSSKTEPCCLPESR